MMDLAKFYNENDDFKHYIDRSSEASGRPKEELFELKTVIYIANYYRYQAQKGQKEEDQLVRPDCECEDKSC